MKPVAEQYLRERLVLEPGKSRLHRLVSRLFDTYIDDLSDEDIEAIEREIDKRRITHADGTRFPAEEGEE